MLPEKLQRREAWIATGLITVFLIVVGLEAFLLPADFWRQLSLHKSCLWIVAIVAFALLLWPMFLAEWIIDSDRREMARREAMEYHALASFHAAHPEVREYAQRRQAARIHLHFEYDDEGNRSSREEAI